MSPTNPYPKGTDANKAWWFGYQKGWFEKFWNKKSNKRWLKEYKKQQAQVTASATNGE